MVHPNNGKMYNNLAEHMMLLIPSPSPMSLLVSLLNHSVHVEPQFITANRNLAFNLRYIHNMEEATKVLVKLNLTICSLCGNNKYDICSYMTSGII